METLYNPRKTIFIINEKLQKLKQKMKLLKQQVKFLKKVPKQELKEVTQNFEFIDFTSYSSFDVFFLCACLIVNQSSYYYKKTQRKSC